MSGRRQDSALLCTSQSLVFLVQIIMPENKCVGATGNRVEKRWMTACVRVSAAEDNVVALLCF